MRKVSGSLVEPPGQVAGGAQLLCGDKLRNAGRQWGLELEFEDGLGRDLQGLSLGDELNPRAGRRSSHRSDCSPFSTSSGWTQRTYKPGDPITVVAHPNMDGSNLVLLFYAIKTDGTRLYRAAHRYDGEKE